MIRPMALADGFVWLHHDREQVGERLVGGHDGVVDVLDLRYPTDERGATRFDQLLLPCPQTDCPFVSQHPIGGGGLSQADTRRLQEIFVERRHEAGWTYEEAFDDVCDLIARTDGAQRNELLAPATPAIPQESPMPETEPTLTPPDLSAAIVAEIDRVLGEPSPYETFPLLRALFDREAVLQAALDQRTDALLRIRATLVAATEMCDSGVTAV